VPPSPTPPSSPSPLLQRLDALTDLAHRHHGLLLTPDGQLTRADAAAAAHTAGLDPEDGRGALELLLLLGIAVGILRAEGLRVRAAPAHAAWRQLDDILRSGLLFAAWCQHATFLPLYRAAPSSSARTGAEWSTAGLRPTAGLVAARPCSRP
jgi:hypothetical protein